MAKPTIKQMQTAAEELQRLSRSLPKKQRGRITENTRRTFTCNVCHTEYSSRREAEVCAARPLEKKMWKVGDRATWRESNVCAQSRCAGHCVGRVVRIHGPEAPDEEYELKWLHDQPPGRLDLHVFRYELEYEHDGGSGRATSFFAYAPELVAAP